MIQSFLLLVVFLSPFMYGQTGGISERNTSAIDSLILKSIEKEAFPGAVVLVGDKEKILYHRAYGKFTYEENAPAVTLTTLYDLASLTKVIATTSAVMHLYDLGKISPENNVQMFIPEFIGKWKDDVTVKHLLLHTSGLPSWKPFYREAACRQEMIERVIETPLETRPGEQYMYSDLGMILLGEIFERISGYPLDEYVANTIFKPLGMMSTMFNPPEEKHQYIAPTEVDTSWRNTLVHGAVHDENAYALEGVAGHAGLFSNVSDLARFASMMLHEGEYQGVRIFQPGTVRKFIQRKAEESGRALGWDTKTADGYSSAGAMFSTLSYGHTGFTGTSLWIDPEQKLYVIFLTNRVHPVRANTKIVDIRPQLHDLIIRTFRTPGQ